MRLLLLLPLTLSLVIFSASSLAQCAVISEKSHVSAVYPTADVLPENLLRFYIYFSKPMKRTNVLSSIYLADEKGNKLEGVFLDNKFDLWSPDNTRLTLLFDPGRVKTGLVAHNAMGRALKPGNDYQLVIDDKLQDANNCDLEKTYKKHFRATTQDYESPNAEKWVIKKPKVNTREALTVLFNGKIDHLSLAYRVRVKTEHGQSVSGKISLANDEREWKFTPSLPWKSGNYSLVVDPKLEDIAGNRVTGLFDQPLVNKTSFSDKWIIRPISLIE